MRRHWATALLLTIATAHAEPQDPQSGRARYARMIAAEAAQAAIPPALADAVATVESGYDPLASGSSGEVGLMQVLPTTAAMLGFHGTLEQLRDPATNIHYGVTYLAGAWTATGGALCGTLMKYRAGYGETVMSVRSILYCHRAIEYLTAIGSPLATGPGTGLPPITPEMLAADSGPRFSGPRFVPAALTRAETVRMRHGQRTADDSRRFWASEQARVHAMQARLEHRRAG